MNENTFDLIIVGAGCAGASGAMYAGRLNIKVAMISKMPGGLIATTHMVENWPGTIQIPGPELAMNLFNHAMHYKVPFINEEVLEITKAGADVAGATGAQNEMASVSPVQSDSPPRGGQSALAGAPAAELFAVKTPKNVYYAKTIIIGSGADHRKLGVPGEKEFSNKGVSYCALCDAAFYRGKVTAIVGSGDSAAKEALMLAEYCTKVYLLLRGDKLRAEAANVEQVEKNPKIELCPNTEIKQILGSTKVEKILVERGSARGDAGSAARADTGVDGSGTTEATAAEATTAAAGSTEEIAVDGVFVAIGHVAGSALAEKLGVAMNNKKEIIIDRDGKTNIPGVYAAGDVTDTPYKQAIIGSAQAILAVANIYDYLGSAK